MALISFIRNSCFIFCGIKHEFLEIRYDSDIGLLCAVRETAYDPTDLIKENMLCNNYTITAKH